ncbi:ribosome maturation factor RimP [Candidatus Phycosocius spiralis]|uniref:Ribosome maturation factor RimP n=1 Tax=Candidatus Phycosocius spiralis TaxID=2815099 RepID=A0ABQ4PVJ0_9PROT|nr:ribosome maturation factor RimP [Candidatus Phycosocius spiralis]GIU67013.1 ribosome maturation factor RimP [Candidatus Phycosocius spiralis]
MRTTSPHEDKLLALIEPAAHDLGYEIVRIRLMGARRKTFQIMAERPDGRMSSRDCEKLSRGLSPLLDAEDPIDGEYTLEVSSPGIDRPLTRFLDFERWVGWEAKLELDRDIDGRKRFSGELAGIEDANVCINLEGEEDTALIPFDWIASARLVLTDDLIRESLSRRGADERELEQLEKALDDDQVEFVSLNALPDVDPDQPYPDQT